MTHLKVIKPQHKLLKSHHIFQCSAKLGAFIKAMTKLSVRLIKHYDATKGIRRGWGSAPCILNLGTMWNEWYRGLSGIWSWSYPWQESNYDSNVVGRVVWSLNQLSYPGS